MEVITQALITDLNDHWDNKFNKEKRKELTETSVPSHVTKIVLKTFNSLNKQQIID